MDLEKGKKFLKEYPFEDPIHATIWEYHIHGITSANIHQILKNVNIDITLREIGGIIRKLYAQMNCNY